MCDDTPDPEDVSISTLRCPNTDVVMAMPEELDCTSSSRDYLTCIHTDILCLILRRCMGQPLLRRVCRRFAAMRMLDRKHRICHYMCRIRLPHWAMAEGLPVSDAVCHWAAAAGNLAVLQHLIQCGYPWNNTTLAAAGGYGHLHMLQWFYSEMAGTDDRWVGNSMAMAAGRGHLHILKWGYIKDLPFRPIICEYAAITGRLDMLQWLRAHKCPWSETTCSAAVDGGHWAVLRWARENGCPRDERTCARAAATGRLDMLQWLRQDDCPWDEDTCTKAVESDSMDILKWARENGCPWNASAYMAAIHSGNLQILRALHTNGCPWDGYVTECALGSSDSEILAWIREMHLDSMESEHVLPRERGVLATMMDTITEALSDVTFQHAETRQHKKKKRRRGSAKK
jgi:hypothetical protein